MEHKSPKRTRSFSPENLKVFTYPLPTAFAADLDTSFETTVLATTTMAGNNVYGTPAWHNGTLPRITDGTAGDQPWQMYYWDITGLAAPPGTQSLYLDFGTNELRTRICEVQAFPPIPEPSTLALLATGLVGLLCYAWRKRR